MALLVLDLQSLDRQRARRLALSMLVTLASSFSPTAKRSGRCSTRSRQLGLADEPGHAVGGGHLDAGWRLLDHAGDARAAFEAAGRLLERILRKAA